MEDPATLEGLCPKCGSSDIEYIETFKESVGNDNEFTSRSKKGLDFRVINGSTVKGSTRAKGSHIEITRENRYICHDCSRSFQRNQETIINGYKVLFMTNFSSKYYSLTRKRDLKELFTVLGKKLKYIGKARITGFDGLNNQEVIHVKIAGIKYTIAVNIYEYAGEIIHALGRMWKGWL